MSDDLLYEVKDQTAFLTINREDRRNAITQEMISSLHAGLDLAEGDETVRAVCLTGKGDRAFCSGADLGLTLVGEGEDRLAGAKNYAALLKKMSRSGKPSIARVNGACLAGGLGLMLSCDIAIAREDASFWTPEVNVGIFPMMVGALLIRQVGRKKMMEMVLTGREGPGPGSGTDRPDFPGRGAGTPGCGGAGSMPGADFQEPDRDADREGGLPDHGRYGLGGSPGLSL